MAEAPGPTDREGVPPTPPAPWAKAWAGKITRAGESRWVWFGFGAVFIVFTMLFVEWVTGRRPGYGDADRVESRPVVPWDAVVRQAATPDPSGSRMPSSLELIPKEPPAPAESQGMAEPAKAAPPDRASPPVPPEASEEAGQAPPETQPEGRRPIPASPVRRSWKGEFGSLLEAGSKGGGSGAPEGPDPKEASGALRPHAPSSGPSGAPPSGKSKTALGRLGRSGLDQNAAKRTGQSATTSSRPPEAPPAQSPGSPIASKEGLSQGGHGIQGSGEKMPLPSQIDAKGKTTAYGKGFEECTVRVVRHNPKDSSSCVIVCQQGKACEAPKDGDMCTMPKGTPLTCTDTISPPGVRLTGSISWDKDPAKGVRVFVTNPNGFPAGWRARWFYDESAGVWDDPKVLEPGKTEEVAKEPTLKKAEIWGDDTLYFSEGDRKAAGTVHFRFALSLPVPPQSN